MQMDLGHLMASQPPEQKRNMLDKLRNIVLKRGFEFRESFSPTFGPCLEQKSAQDHTTAANDSLYPLPNTIKQSVHWAGSSLPNPMETCLHVCNTTLYCHAQLRLDIS